MKPDIQKHYRILRLTAENVKRIKVVDIRPDEFGLVQITGANGSGKSSVLDSIFWALAGTKGVDVRPIRDGEESATIRLELGALTVTRTFTRGEDGETKTSLVVEAESGARFTSPQKMLDDLLGALAFDPLAFSRMAPKAQLDTLRDLVPLAVDVRGLDMLNRVDFENRTAVNRQAKSLEERVRTLRAGVDMTEPVALVDVSELAREMDRAEFFNANVAKALDERDSLEEASLRAAAKAVEIETEIARLRAIAANYVAEAEKKRLQAEGFGVIASPIDLAELRAKFLSATRQNERANLQLAQREKVAAAEAELQAAKDAADSLTANMAQRAKEKADAIAAATMPVDGLSFGDDMVVYNGLPLSQASSAEQLRVSFAIAVAQDPNIRVVRIKDGSLLDDVSLAKLAELAAANDFQVWIERVDTSGRVGVVMVDGEVKAAEVAPTTDSVAVNG